ncbi:ester cyclase [Moritella sp. 28]|uniref:ester cyclase n=1 Tax=Moritella sp. 28 TaxID=2746232 RepID=UPI001BA624E7|nr:ester cyclase [Moritella sp. 28]QUM84367.1 ester cyclase [Moritella sp. 28]
MSTYKDGLINDSRQFMELIWSEKNVNDIPNIMSHNTIIGSPVKLSVGYEPFINTLNSWFRAFPVLNYKENSIDFFEDSIIINWECRGKHLGEFLSVSATGNSIFYEGETKLTFQDKKIINYQADVNMNKLINQISHADLSSQYITNDNINFYKVINKIWNKNLSNRQIECLSLSTLNITTKGIAKLLCIGASSVDTHLKRAFYLLGISNKKMFMSYIIENNTIELVVRIALHLRL